VNIAPIARDAPTAGNKWINGYQAPRLHWRTWTSKALEEENTDGG
jgi:hypothetical protein